MSLAWLVIGLDGASFNLLDVMATRGIVPNIGRLMENGARGRLLSTVPWQTPVAWTSYATGVNPGAHGIYGWWTPDVRSGELRTASGRHVDAGRFWEVLSSAGIRVGVVNVPMSYPARPVNGFSICGFDGPYECMETDPLVSYPPGLVDELRAAGLPYEILPERRPAEDLELAAGRWREGERVRAASVIRLVERFRPEFLQVNLFVTDYFAHRCRIGDPALDIAYGAADEVVGTLGRLAGADTNVLIVSDHGSQPIDKFVLIHLWLQELDLLAFQPWLADEQVSCVTHDDVGAGAALLGRLRREGPALRERLYHEVRDQYPGANVGFTTIDWDRTKAFCSSDYGQIRLNRYRGRAAVVDAREERELCEALRAQFKRLTDPATGETIVEEVLLREALYRGSFQASAPDVTPILRDHSYYFCQVYSFYRTGVREVICPVAQVVDAAATGTVGDHHPYGILIAQGKHIKAGPIADASILDLAPTILDSFAVPGSPQHEGARLLDLYGGERREKSSAQVGAEIAPDALKARLIALGYRI